MNTKVTTTNCRTTLGLFTRPPGHHLYQLRNVVDVARLVDAHRALSEAQEAQAREEPPLTRADLLHRLARDRRIFYDHQIREGILTPTRDSHLLRPTVDSAILFTVKLLPPFRQIRGWLRDARARRALRRAGRDG